MKRFYIKPYWIIIFLMRLIFEIITANLRVAYNVLTLHNHAKPGVIAIPLHAKTDLEITILAIIISLTPGTLALDVTADKKFLFIHAMFIDDKDKIVNNIKSGFERMLMEIMR